MSFTIYLGLAMAAVASSLIILRTIRKRQLGHLRKTLHENRDKIMRSFASFQSLMNSKFYISKNEYSDWKNKWIDLEPLAKKYAKVKGKIEFDEELKELDSAFENGDQLLVKKNEEFIRSELFTFKDFFDNIMAKPLTQDQRRAIITDEKHNLIVAGAGSGKTFTLIGKVAYLLKKELAKPDEILLISFARKVKGELEKRAQQLGQDSEKFTVKTFNSLGLGIIGDVEGKIPSVSKLSTDRILRRKAIQEYINKRKKDKEFLIKLNKYFAFHKTPYKSEFDFKTKGEYITFLRENHVRSLKGDLVKSLEECEIANFLYMNGIKYEYEKNYEVNYASKTRRQYKPDFYLPEYRIYIEHFGIDKDNRTAPFIDNKEYLAAIKWKRNVHKKNQTMLIETYSWEKLDGILLEELERKLKLFDVEFNEIPEEQIFERIKDLGLVSQFSRLLATFLNLFKASRKTVKDLLEESKQSPNSKRYKAFLEILSEVFKDYQNNLGKEIDFDDMINKAEKLIAENLYKSKFKYVLVDEFQDISYGRFKLLKALVDQNHYAKLFCVGDDWQSIYRFNGGDVSIMTDFQDRFDPHERLILDKTFRFNEKLCDFSTKFILVNPNQIKKKIISDQGALSPAVTLLWSDAYEDTIAEILSGIRSDSKRKEKIFIIGRYNHQRPENLQQLRNLYPSLKIEFTTAHSSKGKESDYVIIIGLTSQGYAFPSQIADDPILDLVLAKKEREPNAEERRLFYVAVTRAKKHTYLIASKENPSTFALEIEGGDYEAIVKKRKGESDVSCPACKTGLIRFKHGKLGEFYSCSNFPYCDYKPPMCPACYKGFLFESLDPGKFANYYICSNGSCSFRSTICPSCKNGYLIERNGRYSIFLGCSDFPNCRYTRSLRRHRRNSNRRKWS